MTYETLLIETDENNIVTVTVNRPKALNAINKTVMSELGQFFREDAPQRTEMTGVVLTGAGEKSFVAGADIKEFLEMELGTGDVLAQKGHDIFFAIERFPKPVIAAVNGFALGAGCELAMACHMRIAGEKARFGQPEVNLGIIPGYGGTQRLIQYIGKGKAIELLLTADMIRADEAHRLGLANHVVPVGEEVAKAKEIINKIATKGPVAIAKTIATVNAYFDKTQDGFAEEVKQFGELSATDDFIEGATAFTEKRKANFVGK
ncbi:MAG: enoyl-CoA hydratase/isomerase family protein [Saprospiraceae bacterium]